jgi:hypothetical protein
VGFLVDKAALGQVFSEYFGFPCQAFHRDWYNRPVVASVIVDLVPLHPTRNWAQGQLHASKFCSFKKCFDSSANKAEYSTV